MKIGKVIPVMRVIFKRSDENIHRLVQVWRCRALAVFRLVMHFHCIFPVNKMCGLTCKIKRLL
jgi:hypothetical protein